MLTFDECVHSMKKVFANARAELYPFIYVFHVHQVQSDTSNETGWIKRSSKIIFIKIDKSAQRVDISNESENHIR